MPSPPSDCPCDYVVIRASQDLPAGFLPPQLEGRWFDLKYMPIDPTDRPGTAVAIPSGRFEVRDDGAVAEVWEVRP